MKRICRFFLRLVTGIFEGMKNDDLPGVEGVDGESECGPVELFRCLFNYGEFAGRVSHWRGA